MWWRFLTFCVLVTFILFVVLSCIHGRPVIHLFFHRCCEEDIENDQVIFENFGNNFLRERLVGADIVVDDNESFVSDSEVEDVIKAMREKFNVHDPATRIKAFSKNLTNEDVLQTYSKDLESKLNDLELDLEGNSTANDVNNSFNDSVKVNDDTQGIGEVTSHNDAVSGLDSSESVEMTTERLEYLKSTFPIKLVDVSSSYRSDKVNYSESMSVQSDKVFEKSQ